MHKGGPVSQLISSLEECVPQVPTKLLYRGSRCDLGGYLRKVFLRALSRFPLCSLSIRMEVSSCNITCLLSIFIDTGNLVSVKRVGCLWIVCSSCSWRGMVYCDIIVLLEVSKKKSPYGLLARLHSIDSPKAPHVADRTSMTPKAP